MRREVFVIGAGIVGLATARAIAGRLGARHVGVLEKEGEVGAHQSSHNSGVLHAGLYYKPGSLKAKLAVDGIRKMAAYCRDRDVPHEICGKVVVATTEEEVGRLKTLRERGQANGLSGLRWLNGDELRRREPHAAGLAALLVPEEGIVDYPTVCRRLKEDLQKDGAVVETARRVTSMSHSGGRWRLQAREGAVEASFIVNCAGLHCDRVARLAGVATRARILPFRGEYFHLVNGGETLVKHLIYPVPDPTFPFLGVHFTRMIGGGVEAGPNAVLAMAREGYSKWRVNIPDAVEALSFPGLWRFLVRHRAMAAQEAACSFSKTRFCRALRRLVPEISERHLAPGGAGVRAQAVGPDGTLLQDFEFETGERALHLLNAPSPGATASLAIGELIADRLTRLM